MGGSLATLGPPGRCFSADGDKCGKCEFFLRICSLAKAFFSSSCGNLDCFSSPRTLTRWVCGGVFPAPQRLTRPCDPSSAHRRQWLPLRPVWRGPPRALPSCWPLAGLPLWPPLCCSPPPSARGPPRGCTPLPPRSGRGRRRSGRCLTPPQFTPGQAPLDLFAATGFRIYPKLPKMAIRSWQ